MTDRQIVGTIEQTQRLQRRVDELERSLRTARLERDDARGITNDLLSQLNGDADEVEYDEKPWMRGQK